MFVILVRKTSEYWIVEFLGQICKSYYPGFTQSFPFITTLYPIKKNKYEIVL